MLDDTMMDDTSSSCMETHAEIHEAIQAIITETINKYMEERMLEDMSDVGREWPRKKREKEGNRNDGMDDLFACHRCEQWAPWYCFTRLALKNDVYDDDIYALMMDTGSYRNGKRWACDTCFEQVIWQENLVQ